jgi:Tol biopolymer transport system component
MTTFERFEREIPSLMDEIAPPRLPDYLDNMLGQTGRTRQRPAWASLERWLPMDVVARPVSVRAPALRPLLALLLIGLLIAGGVILYAGSQRTRLPAPFGPARNGVVAIATAGGDIAAVDPATGSRATLVGGPTNDLAPWFSRDGQRLMFVRAEGARGSYWVANADGSNQRELVQAPVEWFEWSDAGDRIVVVRLENGLRPASIVRVADGAVAPLAVPQTIEHAFWRPGHDQILFTTAGSQGKVAYFLVNADGTGRERIAGVSPDAVNDPQFSADGSQLVYATWGLGEGLQGRIHVLDIETGIDRALMFDGSAGTNELDPQFSPDGNSLLFERYIADPPEGGYQLVVASVDGGSVTPIGPIHRTGTDGATTEFSPDGTQVLATYNDDRSTWLLDVDGSGEQQLLVSGEGGTSWQRLAP